MHAAKPKAILSYDKVIDIFKVRPNSKLARGAGSRVIAAVALDFGISEKTVRDIWRGRTWHRETLHLDPCRPERVIALPGRPLGRKDSAPRRRGKSRRISTSRPEVPSPDDTRNKGTNSSETNLAWSPSYFSAAHCQSATPPPLFLNDPFHDDWPHWSRADCFQLQGSHAARPASGIERVLRSKEPMSSRAEQPLGAGSWLRPVLHPTPSPPRSGDAFLASTAAAHGFALPCLLAPAQAGADLPPPPRPWPGDEALVAAGLAGL